MLAEGQLELGLGSGWEAAAVPCQWECFGICRWDCMKRVNTFGSITRLNSSEALRGSSRLWEPKALDFSFLICLLAGTAVLSHLQGIWCVSDSFQARYLHQQGASGLSRTHVSALLLYPVISALFTPGVLPAFDLFPNCSNSFSCFLMLHYTVQGHQPSLKAAISAACMLLSQVHPGFFLKAWSKSPISLSPQIIMVEISLLQDGNFHQTLRGGIIIWLIIPLLLPAAFSCCF